MVTLRGALDMALGDPFFEKEFRMICRLVFEKLGDDVYYIGRNPKKLAYVIVSAVMAKYYHDHPRKITKREVRERLGLSITSAEYTPTVIGGREAWLKFRGRIFKVYDDLKSGKYD